MFGRLRDWATHTSSLLNTMDVIGLCPARTAARCSVHIPLPPPSSSTERPGGTGNDLATRKARRRSLAGHHRDGAFQFLSRKASISCQRSSINVAMPAESETCVPVPEFRSILASLPFSFGMAWTSAATFSPGLPRWWNVSHSKARVAELGLPVGRKRLFPT